MRTLFYIDYSDFKVCIDFSELGEVERITLDI
jgi:hypothetical protein